MWLQEIFKKSRLQLPLHFYYWYKEDKEGENRNQYLYDFTKGLTKGEKCNKMIKNDQLKVRLRSQIKNMTKVEALCTQMGQEKRTEGSS